MNKSGRPKGRSARTKENKVRRLTKFWLHCPKIQQRLSLQDWIKQIKEPNKNK